MARAEARLAGIVLFILCAGFPTGVLLWWFIEGPPQDPGFVITSVFIVSMLLLVLQLVHFIWVAYQAEGSPVSEKERWLRVFLLGPVGVLWNVLELTRSGRYGPVRK